MKKLSIMIMALALVLGMAQCKKQTEQQANEPAGATMDVTVRVQGNTEKTDITSTGVVTWKQGDKLYVVGESQGLLGYVSARADGDPATFSGTITALTSAQTLRFYYVGDKSFTLNGDNFTFDLSSQDGSLAGIAAHSQLMWGKTTGTIAVGAIDFGTITMTSLMSIAHLNIKDGGAAVSGPVAVTGGFATSTFNAKTYNGTTLTGTAGNIAMTFAAGTASTNCYLALLPGTQTLKLTDAGGKVAKLSEKAVAPNMFYNSGTAIAVSVTEPIKPSTVTLTAGCSSENIYNVGGSVTVPSGPHTCEFGFVYSETNAEPTVADTKVVAGTATFSGTKTFSADITGLTTGTTYHVRAYAMIDGATYSTAKDIVGGNVPLPLPSSWTNGKNPHPFTVASGKVVYFSQGNLQYLAQGGSGGNASATAASGANVGGTWRFAEHQFDFIGANNKNAAQTYGGWIDLFGWGTSGYNHGATRYQPWSTSTTSSHYYAYSSSTAIYTYNLYDQSGMADWGKANSISNGGGSSWRTLTTDEWKYLISTRKDGSGKLLYGEGKVGSCTPGLIILPDDWRCPSGLPDVVRGTSSSWSNVYSYSEWSQMEAAGAVFLPAAGYREGTSVYKVGSDGLYWSSSYFSSYSACRLFFTSGTVSPNNTDDRCSGFSVRLVSEN